MPDMEHIRYHYLESSRAELVLSAHTGQEYPWHTHMRYWTLGMVCSGTAFLASRDARCELAQGDTFVMPPNVAYALKVTADTVLAVFCLCPGPDIEENVSALVRGLDYPERRAALPGGLRLSDLEGLFSLALHFSRASVLQGRGPALKPSIQAVVDILRKNPEEPLALGQMAAIAGYSRWHFLRLFREETGLTPHAYQMLCRLRLSRSLLRAGMTAAEAAVSAGFSDQSHMHKAFSLHHGLTPGQFRQAGSVSALQ